MSYYHIDTLQRYIQSLGFKNINNRSIKVNVNGTTDDNSFYSPSTKALTFGTGGVDDAKMLVLSHMSMGIRFKITKFLALVVQQKVERWEKDLATS